MGAVMARRGAIDFDELRRLLAARVEDFCRAYLPNGVREGREWKVGSIQGEKGRSMSICLRGARAGVWQDFSDASADSRGDALDLVAQVLFGGNKSEAVKWARAYVGLDGNSDLLKKTRAVARRRAADEDKPDQRRAEARGRAKSLWLSSDPDILDTPVDRYLLGRGIDLRAFERLPGALRYAARCYERETGGFMPALVAAITDPSGHASTHRVYLKRHEDGRVTKADLKSPRKVYCGFRGGFIPLWRGASGARMGQAPAGETIIITEGIEDGLVAALAMPEFRVVASVSLSNMATIELPDQIGTVVLMLDNDTGRAGEMQAKAVDAAIGFHTARGRVVKTARVPLGKDLNDYLLALTQGDEEGDE